ncbi:MAG: glutamate racemase [Pseudomonadales bacterium]|nr:glutamate racemase [Pseudomonadales bacterium]
MPEKHRLRSYPINLQALPQATTSRILIIDSGVGGLSVFQHICRKIGNCELFYCADNAGFPYGTKRESALNLHLEKLVAKLASKTEPDIVVIACNTASTTALEIIRQTLHKPVIGVVPAIKPAAEMTSGTIGILATSVTIASAYTDNLIKEWASHCEVKKIACDALVQIAEKKIANREIDHDNLKRALDAALGIAGAIDNAGRTTAIDTMVLACTHFPIVQTELESCMPFVKHWVDSGEAIARRVSSVLESNHLPFDTSKDNRCEFIYTRQTGYYEKISDSLKNFGFSKFSFIEP